MIPFDPPEQPRTGHLAIPRAGSDGFSGLLADGKCFQLIHTWGHTCLDNRSKIRDPRSVTSSQASDGKLSP